MSNNGRGTSKQKYVKRIEYAKAITRTTDSLFLCIFNARKDNLNLIDNAPVELQYVNYFFPEKVCLYVHKLM